MDPNVVRLLSKLFPYAVIITLAAIPFALSNEGIIDSVDAAFPLHPIETLFSKQWTWDTTLGFGGNASLSNPNTIPYHLILAFLSLFFPVELLSKVWYIAIFALGGCSMYWFTTSFLKSDYKQIGGFMAAIFFMFNPVQVQALVHGISNFHYTWYALPLVLALFIKVFNVERQRFLLYAIIFSLAYTILQTTTDIQNRLIIMMPYILFFVYELARNKARKEVAARFLACLGILFFFNLFWIMPSIVSLGEVYEIQSSEQKTYRSLEGGGETFLNIIRLSVAPSFDLYKEIWLIEVGIVIFIAAMIGLLHSIRMPEMRSVATYLGISLFFFAILTRGEESPFGGIYSAIFNAPFGDVLLTNAPAKYIYLLLVPMSFFVGIFVSFFGSNIAKLVRGHRIRLIIHSSAYIGVFLLIVSVATPMFTHPNLGNFVVFDYMGSVKVPEYYSEAYDWLKSDKSSFRVLAVPSPAWRGYSHYTWSPYDMAEIIPTALGRPIVMDLPGVGEFSTIGQLPLTRTIANNLDIEQTEGILNTMSKTNIKYVLVRNDLAAGAMGHLHVNNFPVLNQERTDFGALSFYKVPQGGRVYFPDRMVILIGNTNHMLYANAFPFFEKASYYLVGTGDVDRIPYSVVENADAIIYGSSGNRLAMLDNNTLSVTITASSKGGDIPYNIYDITKGAIVISTGTGRYLEPYQSITNTFTLDYLNSVGQVQIDEGDEIVITGIGSGYATNTLTMGPSQDGDGILPSYIQGRIQDAALKFGMIIPGNSAKIDIPVAGYFEVAGTDDDGSLLGLSIRSDNTLEISRDGSPRIFLNRGTYVINNVSGSIPPFFIRTSPQLGQNGWAGIQENSKLSFVENSPTSISIYNPSKEPYIAVLTDGNSALWKTDSNAIRFVADGYANGFIIPEGNTINIYFEPQTYFTVGSIISILAVLVSVAWLTRVILRLKVLQRHVSH
ncbi:alpha-(1-_3)-arabinofuranosyltransferase family protein [Nitrososphaera sp.]|uniref:alpha-(1->3)-arabinofuranosyltransferase domain-containing protein n=1 Tax=Nitrososphaera sp. TaxID=1971748 RepID=UPI0017AB6F20|nr:alpha-(1->3)-arabinofuranosyltransferase family protein [Nitrososphaera sp.]NWG36466.1 DUF3367 domain-containing protein [Nitrososphaera sp.]